MMEKIWQRAIDWATMAWLGLLVVGFFHDGPAVRIPLMIVAVFFAAELAIAWRRRESVRQFLRTKWFDILLLFPVFRIFRLGRLAKIARLQRFIKVARLEALLEWADLLTKGADRIRIRRRDSCT